jgi:hypothetical protein
MMRILTTVVAALFAAAVHAQAQQPAAAKPIDASSAEALSWLYGCWGGKVNQRDFREQWMPLRGGVMLGIGSTVLQDKMQSYEYLRIETRPDGVFYVAMPSGQKEEAFKLVSATQDDLASVFTFSNPEHDFPQRIIYRRATEGWLYATVQGRVKGEDRDREIVYPMRRIDCENGEFIRQ